MATYTPSTLTTSTKLAVNDIINCTYSGSKATIQLPPGEYRLECWGAQGGSFNTTYYGGKGGYSKGDLKLTTNTTLYLYAGGQGTNGTTSGTFAGGFNGGGQAYTGSATYDMSAGGGGTDIRIKQDSLYARVIVAGGGGGAGSYSSSYRYSGGAGGGTSGTTGSQYSTSYRAGGRGAATSAGTSYYGSTSNSTTYGTLASFGQGGAAKTTSTTYYIAGGGGGWYGGGYSRRGPGGGGSGYVYTNSTYSQYPSGCLLNSSYYLTNASTSAGTTSFLSPSGSSETGHAGNGYIRITVLDVAKETKTYLKVSNTNWILLGSAWGSGIGTPATYGVFTIDNVPYLFELGMTYEDWVNSEYNIDNYRLAGNTFGYLGGRNVCWIDWYNFIPQYMSPSTTIAEHAVLCIVDENTANPSQPIGIRNEQCNNFTRLHFINDVTSFSELIDNQTFTMEAMNVYYIPPNGDYLTSLQQLNDGPYGVPPYTNITTASTVTPYWIYVCNYPLATCEVNGCMIQFPPGITWMEWCYSNYNTYGFTYDRFNNNIINNQGYKFIDAHKEGTAFIRGEDIMRVDGLYK